MPERADPHATARPPNDPGVVTPRAADRTESAPRTRSSAGPRAIRGSLMAADLIDAYLLTIAPLVLGTGRRMFPDGVRTDLRLTESETTTKGVVIATYRPTRI